MINSVIIGGGASGLALAIMLKIKAPMISVTVLEANDRVGKKLALTGNGRCNISNMNLETCRYHGDSEFAERIISSFGFKAQKEFFGELGIPFAVLEEGKAYPMSLQAASVVDALRFKAEELGVEILVNEKVQEVRRIDGKFLVTTESNNFKCDTVTVASGGKAGGKLGSELGYSVLKSFGHKIEKIFPSLVQIKTTPEVVRQLKGVKVMADVTATSSSGVRSEYGEVLFCDYGLSGPPILQVSRVCNGEKSTVTLDVLPKMTEDEIVSEIEKRVQNFSARPISELLTGFLHKRLGQVVIKTIGLNLNDNCKSISKADCVVLTKFLKCMTFNVVGTTGFENAQVTAGGAQTTQFFDNMMSKKVKGLFAVGEVLNVDGDCGGFNLAFCWASSYAAALGIKEYLEC